MSNGTSLQLYLQRSFLRINRRASMIIEITSLELDHSYPTVKNTEPHSCITQCSEFETLCKHCLLVDNIRKHAETPGNPKLLYLAIRLPGLKFMRCCLYKLVI